METRRVNWRGGGLYRGNRRAGEEVMQDEAPCVTPVLDKSGLETRRTAAVPPHFVPKPPTYKVEEQEDSLLVGLREASELEDDVEGVNLTCSFYYF